MINKKAYAKVGVDIDLKSGLLKSIKTDMKRASRPEVLGSLGGFGGLFDLSKTKYTKPVLVSSTDSVGTKLKVAFMTGKHSGVGVDIVNHCINDIAVMGAEPLFFLDYFGTSKLNKKNFQAVISGVTRACKASKCALIGGETCELSGFYKLGEYDLVGTIVGIVEKDRILTGETIQPGDQLLGLPSSGLHTNGYTLARDIFFNKLKLKPKDKIPGFRQNLGSALLKPHLSYSDLLLTLTRRFNRGVYSRKRKGNKVLGAIHITGGGFTGNIPRVLPQNCNVTIKSESWPKPPIFKALIEYGNVSFEELYEVFNMGIGMALVVAPEAVDPIIKFCKKKKQRAYHIGEVLSGQGKVYLR